jgi:RNA polymerase sigma-70 factor, ECF subfamily
MSLNDFNNLIANAIAGNRQAFADIYAEYYFKIYNYILRHVWNVDQAKDLAAEVFLSLLTNLHKYKFNDENHFKNFLYKIATNEINEYVRTKKTRKTYLESECEQIITAQAPAEELEEADKAMQSSSEYAEVYKHLITLKPMYQNIIQLKIYEDKTYEDISEITGMSVNTLKSHFARAIKQLKEKMQPNLVINH